MGIPRGRRYGDYKKKRLTLERMEKKGEHAKRAPKGPKLDLQHWLSKRRKYLEMTDTHVGAHRAATLNNPQTPPEARRLIEGMTIPQYRQYLLSYVQARIEQMGGK